MSKEKKEDIPVPASVIRIEESLKFKYKNLSKLENEKIMFFLMASDYDANMILGHEKMTEKDYKRILYILHCLDFIEFHAYVFSEFYDKIYMNGFSDENAKDGFQMKEQVRIYDGWLKDFIDGVPDEMLKAQVAKQIKDTINKT